jgi:hypothetical protein
MSPGLAVFTLIHVALSLVGILAGLCRRLRAVVRETVKWLDLGISRDYRGYQHYRIPISVP